VGCRDAPVGQLYVTSGVTDEVLVLEAADGTLIRRIPVERRRDEIDGPHGVAVSPDGRYWYVSLEHGEPTLWKFERPGDRLVGRVRIPGAGAARIGVTPDGGVAFVPDYDRARPGEAGRVAVISLETLEIVGNPLVCPSPHHAAVSPAGDLVAVACSQSDEIVLLDASSLAEVRRFPAGDSAGSPGRPRYRPLNLAWSPDGEVLYVALHAAAEVAAFGPDGVGKGVAAVGPGPAQIAVTPDGGMIVAANRRDRSLSVVDAATLVERFRVDLGADHPHGVTLDGSGRFAFVACEGTPDGLGRVVAVDLESGGVRWSVPAGAYTLGLAWAGGP